LRKAGLYFVLLTILSVKILQAQDPQFTQFFSAPLYLAPSFAGATQQHRVGAIYRNQWLGIGTPYSTYGVGYDHFFSKFNSGLGVFLLRDMAGVGNLSNNIVSILYSYDFQIFDSWHVRPGLSFQYTTFSIDFNKLTFGDQLSKYGKNPTTRELAPTMEFRGDIDAGTSVLFYSERIWFGGGVDHLLGPQRGFFNDKSTVPMRFNFYGGAQIIKRGRLLKPIDESISLAYLFKIQKDYKQLDLGLYWYKMPLVLGFWYRGIPLVNSPRGDALAFLIGYKTPNFSVGYSYDFTISNLINTTYGSHEISTIFEFTSTKRKKKIHAIPCPEF
jgi:type IX secretion system PorP/SprF family membrane protein